jgi:hypothetical protein
MPCPDHVVIEVQSFCRKLGRADPKKEARRIVEPCISTILFRQDAIDYIFVAYLDEPGCHRFQEIT